MDDAVEGQHEGRNDEAEYAIPSGGRLPQARLLALAECATLALMGAELDSIAVGERTLFERLLPDAGLSRQHREKSVNCGFSQLHTLPVPAG